MSGALISFGAGGGGSFCPARPCGIAARIDTAATQLIHTPSTDAVCACFRFDTFSRASILRSLDAPFEISDLPR
jgi:hypothetical protein